MPYDIQTTDSFDSWLEGLRDARAQAAIAKGIVKLSAGLMGNVKAVREGLSELRVDIGPGYRVYFVTRGLTVIVLLCGGDKRSQNRDITTALKMAADLE